MSRRRQIGRWVCLLALLGLSVPTFYVLSIGPVAFAFQRFELHRYWFAREVAAFYSPLEDYARKSEQYPAKLLNRYVELWIGPD